MTVSDLDYVQHQATASAAGVTIGGQVFSPVEFIACGLVLVAYDAGEEAMLCELGLLTQRSGNV